MTAVSHSELSLSLEMKSIMTVSDKPWGERKTLCACVKITVDLVMSSKALYACEHVRILPYLSIALLTHVAPIWLP